MANITGSGEIQGMPDEDDHLTGSTGDDTIIGSGGADTLSGKDGDDDLVGGYRGYDDIDYFYRYSDDNNSDLLVGGAGNDTYRIGNGDIVVETPGGGDDTVIFDPSDIYDPETDETIFIPRIYTLADNVENLVFFGGDTFNGIGNALNNVIEVYSSDEISDYVFYGTAILDGGAGADTLIGGAGADIFIVDNQGDVTSDYVGADPDADEARDTVIALSHYILSSNIEDLKFAGTGNFIGVGNSQSNLIVGGDGDDTLDGGGTSGWGDDTLIGGKGDDVYRMSDVSDQVLIVENADEGVDTIETTSSSFDLGGADEIENLTFTGEGDFAGYGSDLDNVIRGGAGNDTLSGGVGVDTLVGGTGDDTYEIHLDDEQAATDALIEATNGGTDTVSLQGGTGGTTTYALADHFENLRYEGFRTFVGTGNSANNTIVGGFGDNILDGEAGADTLIGGSAGDSNTFIIDDADDLILGAYSRNDTALVSLKTYVLAEEQAIIWPFGIGMGSVERIAFAGSGSFKGTGNSASNEIVGGASDDTLMGLAGDDTLNGGAGADKMAGGLGNDTYLVDHAGDVAQENPLSGLHGGTDTIIATLKSYTLGRFSYIENLVGGDDGFTGTGNGLDNKITGGSGDDILDGKGGRDTLSGLAGNDTYIVDNDLDFVAEFTTIDDGLTQSDAGGTDLVKTTLAEYALTDFVENLTFIGSGSFTGIGNGLANQITGGSEANTLYGGLDNDKLFGGDGNDRLYGEDGDDFLYGGKGNDTLHGAAGEDIFVFNSAPNASANKDVVKDFVVVDDTIWLSNAIFKTLGSDGALKSSAFFASNTGMAHDKDDRIIYDKDSGVLFYDADGSGKAAAVVFSMISKNLALTYKDFYVV